MCSDRHLHLRDAAGGNLGGRVRGFVGGVLLPSDFLSRCVCYSPSISEFETSLVSNNASPMHTSFASVLHGHWANISLTASSSPLSRSCSAATFFVSSEDA